MRGSMLWGMIGRVAGGVLDPSAWGTLLQRLYDGAATPVEQTSDITGSPMTVVNDLANTGDRRELRAGRAAVSDGVADYAKFAAGTVSELAGATACTVAFKQSRTSGRIGFLFTNINSVTGASADEFRISDEGGSVYCAVDNSADTSGTNIYGGGDFPDDEFYTCVVAFDGAEVGSDRIKVYVNDTLLTPSTPSATLPSSLSSALAYGFFMSANGIPVGKQRDMVVMSRVMTSDERTAFHESSTVPSDNVVCIHRCEEEAGSVAFDSSGNGRHGTYTGTLADIHQPDTGVDYSAANSLGHTVADGSTMYAEVGLSTLLTAGTIIPRDESNPTKCCAYDSGGQVDLQYTGSAPRYGQIIQSGALQGDGVADHVVLTAGDFTALDSAANLSLTVWESGGGNFAEAFGSAGGGSRRIALLRASGNVHAVVENGTNSYGSCTDATSGPNVWTMTYNGGGTANADRLKLYRNGVEVTLSFTGTIPATTASNVSSGIAYLGRANVYSANLEWCHAIHSDTLTPAEVLAIYESGTYPTGNLEALYPCSNITDTGIVPDVSSNGRHGVINGTIADVRAGRQDVVAWNQLHGFDVGFVSGGAATTDYVSTTVTPNASGSVRFKGILSNSGVSQGLFGSSEAAGNFWVLYYDSGGTIRASLGSSANVLVSSTSFGDGDYVDVEIFWDDVDGSCSMHVNDVPEDTAIYTGTVGDNSQGADLGAYYTDGTGHSEPWNGVLMSIVLTDTDQLTAIHSWTLDLADETVLTDSVGSSNGTINGTGITTIIPGLNGIGIDGSTATTYSPGATADKFGPDASQLDRTGGVSHPDANVNSWDATYESGDTQTNPEFVRNAADGDDRFLAYQDTLTGSDLTSAQDYTT